jgi:uncharacterized glyoxalase superfamily protein PhnB
VADLRADGVPAHLDMVVLHARDLPALRRFYRGLGWTEQAGASDSLAFFRLGGVTLALFPHAVGTAGSDVATAADRSGMTLVVRVGTSDAVDTAFAGAAAVGALPVSEPQDQSFGGRSAVMADPEGNRWELLWVPHATADG